MVVAKGTPRVASIHSGNRVTPIRMQTKTGTPRAQSSVMRNHFANLLAILFVATVASACSPITPSTGDDGTSDNLAYYNAVKQRESLENHLVPGSSGRGVHGHRLYEVALKTYLGPLHELERNDC